MCPTEPRREPTATSRRRARPRPNGSRAALRCRANERVGGQPSSGVPGLLAPCRLVSRGCRQTPCGDAAGRAARRRPPPRRRNRRVHRRMPASGRTTESRQLGGGGTRMRLPRMAVRVRWRSHVHSRTRSGCSHPVAGAARSAGRRLTSATASSGWHSSRRAVPIPDWPDGDDDRLGCFTPTAHTSEVLAAYQTDNLLDSSHFSFLHGSLSTRNPLMSEHEVTRSTRVRLLDGAAQAGRRRCVDRGLVAIHARGAVHGLAAQRGAEW